MGITLGSRSGSWKPTKKWWAALVGGLTPIVLAAIDTGWDASETKMTVSLGSALALAYIWRNDSTPAGDGVPR